MLFFSAPRKYEKVGDGGVTKPSAQIQIRIFYQKSFSDKIRLALSEPLFNKKSALKKDLRTFLRILICSKEHIYESRMHLRSFVLKVVCGADSPKSKRTERNGHNNGNRTGNA